MLTKALSMRYIKMKNNKKKLFVSPRFIENYTGDTSKNQNKILIVSDCCLGQEFCGTIGDKLTASVDVLFIDTSLKTRASIVARHLSYIILALKAKFIGRRYSHVIFWQQYIALHWCAFSRLSFISRPPVYATLLPLIFIKRAGLLGGMAQKYFSSALAYRGLKTAICHSVNELDYYKDIFPSLSEKLCFIPFGMDYSEPANLSSAGNESYYFSGGASNRDYEIIIRSALDLKDTYFKIACKPENVPETIDCPPNVKFIFDAYGEEFERLIASAEGVIITLKDLNISAGQIVIMRAMAMGKTIIASDSMGLSNYINDDNAYLIDSRAESLTAVINNIKTNEAQASKKAERALCDYRENFSSNALATGIAEQVLVSLGAG